MSTNSGQDERDAQAMREWLHRKNPSIAYVPRWVPSMPYYVGQDGVIDPGRWEFDSVVRDPLSPTDSEGTAYQPPSSPNATTENGRAGARASDMGQHHKQGVNP